MWLPGIAFALSNGRTRPLPHDIVRFAMVTTCGSPWRVIHLLMGDLKRKVIMHGIRQLFARDARKLWKAPASARECKAIEARDSTERAATPDRDESTLLASMRPGFRSASV